MKRKQNVLDQQGYARLGAANLSDDLYKRIESQ